MAIFRITVSGVVFRLCSDLKWRQSARPGCTPYWRENRSPSYLVRLLSWL